MKVVFPTNGKTKSIKVPNFLIANRLSFGILKLILVFWAPVIYKVKYKHIKPFIKLANQYKDYEIVTIKTRQGEIVKIYL